jgi:DNA mismatch repair protein MutL
MGRIAVLDQNMINMIAAGEVIERPASVVKELMENSIDAGASKIIVNVEDGGRRLMSVSDDGCGMDADDLVRAFEPHTTSKIRTLADLHNISTLGFRGEALASIAAIAQVRAVSKVKDSQSANCVEIDCGTKCDIRPCPGDYGTTIQVRDIFYKLPARRKFLRTANTEMEHITEQFVRIALPSRHLEMTLIHNNREVCRASGGMDLKQKICQMFPMLACDSADTESLIEARSDEREISIHALFGKPNVSKTGNKFQYIYLNGRFIRDKFISHAIKEAYRGLLDPNRFPVAFVFIEMPCADYDVNVHPTKIEVRFFNPNLVYSQVLGCLREKLLGTNLDTPARIPIRAVQFERKEVDTGTYRSQNIAEAMSKFFERHRSAQSQEVFDQPALKRAVVPFNVTNTAARTVSSPQASENAAQNPKFLQIHDSFIIEQTEDGFVIIDQHALHERIIYESLRRRAIESKLESQRLLIPESFELSDARAAVLTRHNGLLGKLGIEVAPFGPRTYAVQAFPSVLAGLAPVDFVQDLIDLLVERAAAPDSEQLLDEVLHIAACKAAIKAGQRLSYAEIEQLLADREKVECTSHCPHGRPTTIKFSVAELEKQFKRT